MTHDHRPDPDALLAQVQREESVARKGRLFILLGMCPGVGKTYAMLALARQRQAQGVDVLAGVVETHGRSETAALLEGLPLLTRTQPGDEFDLDGALERAPELLLVDELAHTNATGSRHAKRWQDVLELLEAGIDVVTTLNVQHIDSQVDVVRQITGVIVRETVPDSILDLAHEIQLIDLSVEKLKARLSEGKVYMGERAKAAADGFFKEENLTALRELALRFTAERVDKDLEDIRKARRVDSPWKTNARLLVAVGATPYSESLIRWTRRASGRLGCPWIAVWVEGIRPLTEQQQRYLERSLGLARRLGGEVVHATGENIPDAILRTARDRNVSQIVVGKSNRLSWWRPSLADRIIAGSGDIDVCIVRPVIGAPFHVPERAREPVAGSRLAKDFLLVLAVTAAITWGCFALRSVTGYMMPALVYLLVILLMAFRVGRGPIVLMAALCAACWDFFFISPEFTFQVRSPEDIVMLVVFFAVALSMGHLTNRLRKREIAERRRQAETEALLRVTQSAALSPEMDKGLREALRIIGGVVSAEVALLVRNADHSFPSAAHPAGTYPPDQREMGVAAWTFANRKSAGRDTDTLPQSEATWFPLQTATSMMGVLGIRRVPPVPLDFTARQAVEAFALQLALVLEKEHFIQAVAQAELTEKSDSLRRNLLDSVSHELKTPLAVIRAAIDGMEGPHGPYVEEIDTAAKRLQRLVESLLQMTRLESQVIEPKMEWSDIHEIVSAAIRAAGDAIRHHSLSEDIPEDLPLIRTDQSLLVQALANILHNAAIYSPAGSSIEISAIPAKEGMEISIRDHGPGLSEGDEAKIFGKFYRAAGSPAGGTGLGLSISRGFIGALGGDVTASTHPQGGALFVIALKAEMLDQGTVV